VVLADAEHAVAESDVIALLVDHSCFRAIKKTQLTGKVVYDTRGAWG
jgi:UDP-N-acetyl-D-mannosaminuronic acid dehydrogenase